MNEYTSDTQVQNQIDEKTLTISVMIDGISFNRSLAEDLKVSPESINEYLIQNPGKTAYWSTWHGKAKIAAAVLKTAYEETLASERERVRSEAKEKYISEMKIFSQLEKKEQQNFIKPSMPTVSEVDDRAILSDNVKIAYMKLIKANEVVQLLAAAVNAIRDLSSTLASLSANMRQELKSFNNTIGPDNTMRAHSIISKASQNAGKNFIDNTEYSPVDLILEKIL